MKYWGMIAVALLFQPSTAFAAKEPIRLKPSSKWVAEFADQGCRLIREFGEGKDKATIVMSRYAPAESFRMTIAGELFDQDRNKEAKLQFGPNEAEQSMTFYAGNLGKDMPAMIFASAMRLGLASEAEWAAYAQSDYMDDTAIKPLGTEREKAVTFLKIGKPLRQPVILELGRMDRPLAVMGQCIDNLMTTWGIDVEKHKTLSRRATPDGNPGNWIKSSDYPVAMLNQGQPALVEFRMDVDEKGAATGCHIQATTRPKAFDDAVCKSLLRRAKFTPALDAQQQPIKSYWKSSVRFQIPTF
jgi:hypothetical protein